MITPSLWDRVFCALFHDHERWRVGDTLYRRCQIFGCGILVVKKSLRTRVREKARKEATAVLRRLS
jgi:hypothetical protein